ncbi:hypothetical protein M0R45_007506 [Rubus argutus]|uniref:FBD domain-containing protein n=1 Tax=Rubus argutus TaxID=59490 RepID=A0AAW1XYY9_RUBAR
MELDRISNLPSDVMDQILSGLTLNEGSEDKCFVDFFVDLPHIQRLTIDGFAAQYLAVGDLPGRLPKPCLDLNFLRLLVYYNDLAEILTTLYLLRSSPALEVLHVTVHEEEEEEEDVAVDEEANSCFKEFAPVRRWSSAEIIYLDLVL